VTGGVTGGVIGGVIGGVTDGAPGVIGVIKRRIMKASEGWVNHWLLQHPPPPTLSNPPTHPNHTHPTPTHLHRCRIVHPKLQAHGVQQARQYQHVLLLEPPGQLLQEGEEAVRPQQAAAVAVGEHLVVGRGWGVEGGEGSRA